MSLFLKNSLESLQTCFMDIFIVCDFLQFSLIWIYPSFIYFFLILQKLARPVKFKFNADKYNYM